jgi:pimeloyl-ACP methyl ester carboxylesterase
MVRNIINHVSCEKIAIGPQKSLFLYAGEMSDVMRRVYLVFFICLAISQATCGLLQDRRDLAEIIAARGNLASGNIHTGQFALKTFHRGLDQKQDVLAVYIEGDGDAWKRKNVLTGDPTPGDPVALKLAARDSGPAVLYVARPCQYLVAPLLEECPSRYWSTHRYAEEVIDAIETAVNWGVNQTGAGSVVLYGYSGGGTVAALLAARRNDVIRLVTIAANLDHRAWTELHGVSPLEGSINAVDFAASIQYIPQLHLVGADDDIVPVTVVEAYRARAPDPSLIVIRSVPGFDHHCCWEEAWPKLLSP